MIVKGIRKLPKYMVARIKKYDLQNYPDQNGNTRFYCYLVKQGKELVKYTVAVRNYRKQWFCKQVVVHALHSKRCYINDICYNYIAGYKVGWYLQGITKYQRYYEDGQWDWHEDRYFNIDSDLINPEVITTIESLKYSQGQRFRACNLFRYLRLYEQYPIAEMLVKLNLNHLAMSVTILRLLDKDKHFRKWLFAHHGEIRAYYYIPSIIKAYKEQKSIELVYERMRLEKDYRSSYNNSLIKQIIPKDEAPKLFAYLEKQHTNLASYEDYLNACRYLNLDLTLLKHRYPHDFQHWHDVRIDQYHTQQAQDDECKRLALRERFKTIANKYSALERLLVRDDYICVIAKSPNELVYEGEQLNHCVGRMNYDQKFAREETLIFFVRNRLAPNTPLVTLEYSLANHKVLQCYGHHDSKPADEILNYVHKKWLPYANRKLKGVI